MQSLIKLVVLFGLAVLGSRQFQPDVVGIQSTQHTIMVDPLGHLENPKYSNSSFPDDQMGDSPFFYCPKSDPENDLFLIDTLVLNPNPPRINHPYVFHAHGYFREEMLDLLRGNATVKREDENGLDFTIDFNVCGFLRLLEIDRRSTQCPPFKGYATLNKAEFVDFGVPEGNYSLKIDVRGNGKRVFCIQSWFEMTRKEFRNDD